MDAVTIAQQLGLESGQEVIFKLLNRLLANQRGIASTDTHVTPSSCFFLE